MVMFPDGSNPDEPAFSGFTPAQPALPSRATGETKPLTPLPQTGETPRRTRGTPRAKPSRARSARRKRALEKAAPKPRRKTVEKRAPKRTVAAPKNPNRPLEAKNRLNAVLAVVATMSKQESIAFAGMMSHLEDMTGPARRKVIGALGQVYA